MRGSQDCESLYSVDEGIIPNDVKRGPIVTMTKINALNCGDSEQLDQ